MTANLLLVDDDELFCKLTKSLLEKCGHTVTTAQDGQAAWEIIDQDPYCFDLMLLDRQMPKLDGIALLKRIKQDGRYSDFPVIMLTADKSQEDLAEGLAAGAFHYLVKPAGKNVLDLIIKNILSEFSQKRELRKQLGQHANNMKLLHKAEFRFKTLSEAHDMAVWLAMASMNPGRTLTGYSELLINAVEHGNLGITYKQKSQLLIEDRWMEEVESRLSRAEYATRSVRVLLEKTDSESIVTIIDEGEGFDWRPYMEFSPERAFDLHGRGIAMSSSMSFDSLNYQDTGNTVVTRIKLPAA